MATQHLTPARFTALYERAIEPAPIGHLDKRTSRALLDAELIEWCETTDYAHLYRATPAGIAAAREHLAYLAKREADGRTFRSDGEQDFQIRAAYYLDRLEKAVATAPATPTETPAPTTAAEPAATREFAVINTATGDIRVHAADCADVARDRKRHRTAPEIIRSSDQRSIVTDFMSDFIDEGCEPEDLDGDFVWLPCCGDLTWESPRPIAAAQQDPAPTDEAQHHEAEILSQALPDGMELYGDPALGWGFMCGLGACTLAQEHLAPVKDAGDANDAARAHLAARHTDAQGAPTLCGSPFASGLFCRKPARHDKACDARPPVEDDEAAQIDALVEWYGFPRDAGTRAALAWMLRDNPELGRSQQGGAE